MSAPSILSRLHSLGVSLWAEGDQLRFRAAPGVLTEGLRAELARDKALVLAWLRDQDAGPRPREEPIAPVPRTGPLELSFAQERLWFLHRLAPDSAAYSMPFALRLRGPLDAEALWQSLGDIVRRHEILRTTLHYRAGAAHQVIAEPADVALPVDDLSRIHFGNGHGTLEANVDRLLAAEVMKPFDLTAGPLMRPRLLRIADDDHVLSLVFHHVAFDEWSMAIFMRELAACYRARRENVPAPLAPPALQYADYAAWQRRWMESPAAQEQLNFWRRQLAGEPPVLELPADRPRASDQLSAGAHLGAQVPPDIAASFQSICRAAGATPFMGYLALFKTLLHRDTGQCDILVGVPVANRQRTEIEPVMGFFANTLVHRTDLSGNPAFTELLQRVRTTTLESQSNQELPFDRIVDALRPQRESGRNPLFNVAFNYRRGDVEAVEMGDLRVTGWPVESRTSKFDLMMTVSDHAGSQEIFLEYATALFDEDTMRRLLDRFLLLLRAVVADAQTPIGDLPILPDAERRRVVHDFNDTARDYPRDSSIGDRFTEQARLHAQRVAIVDGEATVTYAQLNQRANRLAHLLIARGVAPGDRVAVCMGRSAELIVALLGILKAGAAYVPLDPDYPALRLEFMLTDVAAAVLLTDSRTNLGSLEQAAQVIRVDSPAVKQALEQSPATDPAVAASAQSLAYIIFTSGSTGTPKGVAVPHRGVMRLAVGGDYAPLGPDQRTLVLASTSFDASTFEMWGPLLNGGRCVIFPDRVPDLARLESMLVSQQINSLWLTAALFNTIIDQRPRTLHSVGHLMIGGEALSPRHVRRALDLLPRTTLVNGYGPTESTTFACTWPIPRNLPDDARNIPIGRPITNTQAYILDAKLRPAPIGIPGELCIGGDGLAIGYWNRPDLTADRFVTATSPDLPHARLYRTGDRCRWRADGTIEFLGRLDRQIKLHGHRIEPGEIEAALVKHPDIRQAAVLVKGTGGDCRLIAYAVAESAARPSEASLRDHLRSVMPAYMIPHAFVLLDAMPLSPNGKVDRDALPEPVRGPAPVEESQPRSDTEKFLAELWAGLLNIDRVGIHENFFDLGGRSLMAVRMFDEIATRFGRAFPLVLLFERSTIAQLAAAIDHNHDTDGASLVVPIKPDGDRLPFFCIHGIGGDVLFLEPMARHFHPRQPFYGVRAMGTNNGEVPDDSIPAMARRYLHAIRAVQPHGPYRLGGFSAGGSVALEMAQQLIAAGESVQLLAIFDHGPTNMKPLRPRWHPVSIARVIANLPCFILDDILFPNRPRRFAVRLRAKVRGWFQQLLIRCRLRKSQNRVDIQAMFGVSNMNEKRQRFLAAQFRALHAYVPNRYPGRVVLFRARTQALLQTESLEEMWTRVAEQGVESVTVPGSHEGICYPPHAATLAKVLDRYLSRE